MKNLRSIIVLFFAALYCLTVNSGEINEQERPVTLDWLFNVGKSLFTNGAHVHLQVEDNRKFEVGTTRNSEERRDETSYEKIIEQKKKGKEILEQNKQSSSVQDYHFTVKLHPSEDGEGLGVKVKIPEDRKHEHETIFSELVSNSVGMNPDKLKELEEDKCDKTINWKKITPSASVVTESRIVNVNDVICVELENRSGTGYIWKLIGVYNEKPAVDPKMFPTTPQSATAYVSDDIIVTQPKIEPLKQSPAEEVIIVEDNGVARELLHPREHLVGGATPAKSKIKPFKSGAYYVVYSFYRPFDPENSPNTRILFLTVN